MRAELSLEHDWCLRVDGSGKQHKALGEYVCGESQYRVTVYPGMLKVDSCSTIGTNNDLELYKTN